MDARENQVVEILMQAVEESRALTLALMDTLAKKTQNIGSVRRLEPILSKEDAQEIFEKVPKIRQQLLEVRQKVAREAASSLVLPPGARS